MRPLRASEPPKKLRKLLPEDMARDAIAAEVLVARAIHEEKNIGALVTEVLEAAAANGR